LIWVKTQLAKIRERGWLKMKGERMVKLIALAAFTFVITTSAQAMPRAVVQQSDSIVITVREACGAGMHRVNGVCIRTPARRQAARCAAGLRYVGGRCIR
jgi:nitrate reductase beta subunit